MYILYQCNREENGSEIITPMVCSSKESVLEEYLNRLLKDSEEYEFIRNKHIAECKLIIKEYLQRNLDAIIGWADVRSGITANSPVNETERNAIITYLSSSYFYAYGENIVENKYNQSFIPRYCDVSKLIKPYPVLPAAPQAPTPYLTREFFRIEPVKNLDK
jgi:hypothetical protein